MRREPYCTGGIPPIDRRTKKMIGRRQIGRSENQSLSEAMMPRRERKSVMSTNHVSNGHNVNGHSKKGESKMNTHVSKSVVSHAVPSTPNGASSDAPSAAQIQQALAELDVLASILGAHAVPLSIEERRRVLKMRPGGAQYVPTVLGLAERYGLSIPGVGSAEAKADMDVAAKLRPLADRLTVVAQLVEDTILRAQGRAWQSATTAYTMLTRLVGRFPSLQGELDAMASFLAVRHKAAPQSLRKKPSKKRPKKKSPAASPPTAAPIATTHPSS
jgi:hypothetical protein